MALLTSSVTTDLSAPLSRSSMAIFCIRVGVKVILVLVREKQKKNKPTVSKFGQVYFLYLPSAEKTDS
jgi:hypothetical protein